MKMSIFISFYHVLLMFPSLSLRCMIVSLHLTVFLECSSNLSISSYPVNPVFDFTITMGRLKDHLHQKPWLLPRNIKVSTNCMLYIHHVFLNLDVEITKMIEHDRSITNQCLTKILFLQYHFRATIIHTVIRQSEIFGLFGTGCA